MRKRLSLPALVLFITACAPALPKTIEPPKTLDVGLAAQTEAKTQRQRWKNTLILSPQNLQKRMPRVGYSHRQNCKRTAYPG